mmetsp:Transcript_37818/g.105219  ORF Transcript_37818/g.105219 Transcript_37818/m.105219 type:complete len:95 (-) Transcript_37818:1099-1383(-)
MKPHFFSSNSKSATRLMWSQGHPASRRLFQQQVSNQAHVVRRPPSHGQARVRVLPGPRARQEARVAGDLQDAADLRATAEDHVQLASPVEDVVV